MIELTENAVKRLKEILETNNSTDYGIRLFISYDR